jgi:hypothetical protein
MEVEAVFSIRVPYDARLAEGDEGEGESETRDRRLVVGAAGDSQKKEPRSGDADEAGDTPEICRLGIGEMSMAVDCAECLIGSVYHQCGLGPTHLSS